MCACVCVYVAWKLLSEFRKLTIFVLCSAGESFKVFSLIAPERVQSWECIEPSRLSGMNVILFFRLDS